MVLAIGKSSDALLREIHRQSGAEVILCEEAMLYESVPFALEKRGPESSGYLQVHGRTIGFGDLSGVILRPPRMWWPGDEYDLRDQMFVYHETAASWFAIFSSLECPVINRFGLGWWLQDLGYALELKASLSLALGLPATVHDEDPPILNGRIWPTVRDAAASVASVYIAGSRVIGVPGSTGDLAEEIRRRGTALPAWQEETGISLCRVDFEHDDAIRIRHVETFPLLEDETAGLAARIASATLEHLTAGREVTA